MSAKRKMQICVAAIVVLGLLAYAMFRLKSGMGFVVVGGLLSLPLLYLISGVWRTKRNDQISDISDPQQTEESTGWRGMEIIITDELGYRSDEPVLQHTAKPGSSIATAIGTSDEQEHKSKEAILQHTATPVSWRGTAITISDELTDDDDLTAIAVGEIWRLPNGLEEFPDAKYSLLGDLAPGSEKALERQRQLVELMKYPLEIRTKVVGMRFRLIPPGTFTMGSPKSDKGTINEGRQHKVTLTKPLYIGTFAVTQGQWAKVMGNYRSQFREGDDNAPITRVSWNACTCFMRRLAVVEGIPPSSFRLPTDAEWEYACREGTQTAFGYRNEHDSPFANFNGNHPHDNRQKGEGRKTVPVGQFKPNAWGVYDMYGNVCEWCADWDRTRGAIQVYRGGRSYCFSGLSLSAATDIIVPDNTSFYVGFRLSLPIGQ